MPSITDPSKIPKLNKSLCGCRLLTATKIVGFLEVIFNLLMLVLSMVGLVFMVEDWPTDEIHYLIDGIPVLLFLLLVYIFKGLISVYLLIGVYKNKLHYVKTWVVIQGGFLAVGALIFVCYLFMMLLGYWDHPMLIIQLVSVGVQIYYVLIVYSYYRDETTGIGSSTGT